MTVMMMTEESNIFSKTVKLDGQLRVEVNDFEYDLIRQTVCATTLAVFVPISLTI